MGILVVPGEAAADHVNLSHKMETIYSVTKNLEFIDIEENILVLNVWETGREEVL